MTLLSKPLQLLLIVGGWAAFVALNSTLLPPRLAPHVQTERVQLAPLPLLVRASGNLNPKDSNTVKSQFEGTVTQKLFREGQRVKKGQLLFVMGREKIRIEYQNKKDALENASADLAKARREVRLQRALYQKQAVARSAVEDAERAVIKAEQALRSAQETFNEMQKEWDSAQLNAPMDGTIVKDWIGDDKTVGGGKEVFTVADVSEFSVHARVDELEIRSVHEDQKAEVRLPGFGSVTLPAVVSEIGTAPEANGLLSVPVVLKITDTHGLLLRPKLTAEATIFTGVTEPVLSVPAEAVANADGETRVWVLDSVHRLRSKKVVLGRSNPDRVEITQGVAPGTSVVTSAEPEFADGTHVIIGADTGESARSKTHAILDHMERPKKNMPNTPRRPL